MRMEMKKEGRLPPRTYQELPLNISSTHTVMDAFKPPEGDGKVSFLSKAKLTEGVSYMMRGPKHLKHIRKLKKYEDFVESEFATEAQKIVVEAQQLLKDVYKNQDRLHELVTERAFPEMVFGLENKTMFWQMVETVEPPKVVQIRTDEMVTADNIFAQVTVRMHTKQILAIYDRFGRLMYGDPNLPKSVVEYVVMEKWISDTYGRWRVHSKIIPDWMSPRDSLIKTYKVPNFDPIAPEETEKKADKTVKDKDDDAGGDDDHKRKESPQVALA
uniref:Large ribosomal subunit protein mL45 n=1 Tax=Arion vulgaris TaxID=1028688 RepID=A0A0B6ZYM5_9EUPU